MGINRAVAGRHGRGTVSRHPVRRPLQTVKWPRHRPDERMTPACRIADRLTKQRWIIPASKAALTSTRSRLGLHVALQLGSRSAPEAGGALSLLQCSTSSRCLQNRYAAGPTVVARGGRGTIAFGSPYEWRVGHRPVRRSRCRMDAAQIGQRFEGRAEDRQMKDLRCVFVDTNAKSGTHPTRSPRARRACT